MKSFVVVVMFFAILASVFGSPYYFVHAFKEALVKKDYAALLDAVDYPRAKEQIFQEIDDAVENHSETGFLEMISGSVAGYTYKQKIEKTLTPKRLDQLINPESLYVGSGGYTGFSSFIVPARTQEGHEIMLLLRRSGFGWEVRYFDLSDKAIASLFQKK